MLPSDVIDGLHVNPLTGIGFIILILTFLIAFAIADEPNALTIMGLLGGGVLMGIGFMIEYNDKVGTVVSWAEEKYDIQIPENQNANLIDQAPITLEDGTKLILNKADNDKGYLLYTVTDDVELLPR
jgi:hypothetical protein